jgi:hypothetical protein
MRLAPWRAIGVPSQAAVDFGAVQPNLLALHVYSASSGILWEAKYAAIPLFLLSAAVPGRQLKLG